MQEQEIRDYEPLLRGIFLFEAWSPALVARLRESGTISGFARGERICGDGEPRLGVLLSGRTAVHALSGGEAILNVLQPGDVFGAAAVFLEGGISAVTAQTACRALLFTRAELTALLAAEPAASQAYITFLSRRIAFLNRKIAAFTGGEAQQRLAAYLLSAPPQALAAVNCSALAKRLDIGRASLYRALDSLIQADSITRDGKAIVVIDREKLKQMCR